MKVSVDIGNRNMKVCYKEGEEIKFIVFQSRYSTEEQIDYGSAEVIELEGIKYCIEQGSYDYEFNKTEKDYLPLLLTAISRVLKLKGEQSDENIELMIGSPVEHVIGLRNKFKEQLLGQEFEYKYKDKAMKIKINKLGVIGEGFATYFCIPNVIKNENKNLGICDIGGRTINIATFIKGKQDKFCTINFGTLDIKNDILREEKSKGKDYDLNIIENLLESQKLEIHEDAKKRVVEKIINDAKIYKIDIDLYKWIVTGGGAIDIGSEIIEEYFGKDCTIENPIFSNVLGYYNFMIAKWGEDVG